MQRIAAQKFLSCPLANYHIAGLSIHITTLIILALAQGMLAQKSLCQGGMKPSLDGREEETVHLHNFCITQSETRVDIVNANGAKKDDSASPLTTRGNLSSAVLVGSRLPLYIVFLFPVPEHKP